MDSENGFTLLEVLVALAVLGGSLASFYQALGGSLHAATTAGVDRRITAAAANIMAEIGHSRSLEPGTTSGKLPSGEGWILKLEIEGSAHPSPAKGAIVGYNVDLEIRRGAHEQYGSFVVHTVLLGSSR